MSLKDVLKGIKRPKDREILWKGPEIDGITFSLLSRYLTCKERFRIHVMDGLRAQDQFNHRLEYGNMWHLCEEMLADDHNSRSWELGLRSYCSELCKRYPTQQEQIDKYYRTCLTQFPVYVDYWRRNPDVMNRTNLMAELSFRSVMNLPSGRRFVLRGKFDSVDVIGTGKDAGIYLQENKTKGDIEEGKIQRQLSFDLQTMIYLTALRSLSIEHRKGNDVGFPEDFPLKTPIKGVRYNVVRRPWSGGKGSIVRHKPTKSNPNGESQESFFERFKTDYLLDDPGYWFMRWKIDVRDIDVVRFQKECLIPILENLHDDWEWWKYCHDHRADRYDFSKRKRFPDHQQRHYRHPFGVYNVLDEGGSHDLDEYLATGSEIGLQRSENLFPEL